MPKVIVSKRINASVDEVWASWDDFANIYKFNPNLSGSHLVSSDDVATRVGTQRQCDMVDGKNWIREEIIDYKPGKLMKLDIYDGTLPLKSMVVDIEFEELSSNRTRVRFTADFEPKFGVAGKLMVPLMKRQFQPMLQALLDANADFVEDRKEVVLAA
jgi:ribosome-associated toxin RatA of RatAB toxin-antitoxin module